MDSNKYRKIVHASLWFDNRIALSKRLKEGYHKGFWCDAGGKVEKNETLLQAVRRETREETGLDLYDDAFNLIDCFIYSERKLKTFLFAVYFEALPFELKNPEPEKQCDWQLFTKKEALKLKLMPSVRFYLESIKND